MFATLPPMTKPGFVVTHTLPLGALSFAVHTWLQNNPHMPLLVITAQPQQALQLEEELTFLSEEQYPVYYLPDWETLPYDLFSPHPSLTSTRLGVLSQLPHVTQQAVVIVALSTLLHRFLPHTYLQQHHLALSVNQTCSMTAFIASLSEAGYRRVASVQEPGEFAVRGGLLDVFPSGTPTPFRIEWFDDIVEHIRTFDVDTQRTEAAVSTIGGLPAYEFPLNPDAIAHFRQRFRAEFSVNPNECPLYQQISQAIPAPGIEYYLPLFYDTLATLFDYLPPKTTIVTFPELHKAAEIFWTDCRHRYEQRRHDTRRPILPPDQLFLPVEQFFEKTNTFPRIDLVFGDHTQAKVIPSLHNQTPGQTPGKSALTACLQFMQAHPASRVLLLAESTGRREVLRDLLQMEHTQPTVYPTWADWIQDDTPLGLMSAPHQHGVLFDNPALCLITENEIFGQTTVSRRRRKETSSDPHTFIRSLTELRIGDPVVHLTHGVGRYLGLQSLTTNHVAAEYLMLEYAGGDKIYVPIMSLHLISRYICGDPEKAPLHKLGSDKWDREQRKAKEEIRDVAAELLDLYSKREATTGFAFPPPDADFITFRRAFPFEETPDQTKTIEAVIDDMQKPRPMDRLVCGDVGFGKTEVAMQAAFLAAHAGKQVAIFVPTTLLASQHYHNFKDRFAEWPMKIACLSRLQSARDSMHIRQELHDGKIDILIGTHKLLSENVQFKDLGLVIVDEEHRFGVQQKERLKTIRNHVDMLTLTATPIPRTLNFALSHLRDLSIIATPPLKRISVKTFVHEYDDALIQEALYRELARGGQAYILHNDVATITKMAEHIQTLLPEARLGIAHGQMREGALERVMSDFYHQRFQILLCTTIIESGIDVPTANTIIINRADRLGLAQLHQLRGRVGRSHHQAYAYLLAPAQEALTPDAQKRLEAIANLGDLGAGFALASQDLEIRGAGELLGAEQSGHMDAIGFSLYMELLEETLAELRNGQSATPTHKPVEIELGVPALFPSDYIGDVQTRLSLYKRLADTHTAEELADLKAEIIDRFGPLPLAAETLCEITALKQAAVTLGIHKIEIGSAIGHILFVPKPPVDPLKIIELIQKYPKQYQIQAGDRLRFACTLQDAAGRLAVIRTLLTKLA
ncbi:MAG: transcription-repair coupling factor [Gammaproteobacteria bacterium RIFCSPHIGHO2_12_FULL_45_9]|nr:MAG: transcription-repair coupling factor [Gammaproteobacteria bacterium RIFCSPHIGHO2_12_FULL_45_9]